CSAALLIPSPFPPRRASDLDRPRTLSAQSPLAPRAALGRGEDDRPDLARAKVRRRGSPRSEDRGKDDENDHGGEQAQERRARPSDRKSTRLNSSHEWISYAV